MYPQHALFFPLLLLIMIHGCGSGSSSNSKENNNSAILISTLISTDNNLSENNENLNDNNETDTEQNNSSIIDNNAINNNVENNNSHTQNSSIPDADAGVKTDSNNIDNNNSDSNQSSEASEEGNNSTDNSNNNTPLLDFSEIQGKVVDGELLYATLFLDLNLNGMLDKDEPRTTTDENGAYRLLLTSQIKEVSSYKNQTAPIMSVGGFDKQSKQAFQGLFTAPFEGEYLNVTPITTILLKMLQERETDNDEGFQVRLNRVKRDLAQSLSIDEDDLTKDPIALAKLGEFTLLRLSLQIHQSSELLSRSIKGGETINIYTILAKELNKREAFSSINRLFQNTIESNPKKFESIDMAKASVRQLNSNIQAIFNENRDKFNSDSTTITKISIIIDEVKEDIEEAVNRGDSTLTEDKIWQDKYKEHEIKDINLVVVRKLLKSIEYDNERVTKEISKISGIDSSLTLESLKSILLSSSKYSNIVDLIDKQLKELKEEKAINDPTSTEIIADGSSRFLTLKRQRTQDWAEGFCEEVKVSNQSSQNIIWSIEIKVGATINKVWSAVYTEEKQAQTIKVSGLGRNRILKPKRGTTFGFCATKNREVDDNRTVSKNSDNLLMKQKVTESWESGFCETVTLNNPTDTDIEWNIVLNLEGEVYKLWDAEYTQDEVFTLTVKGASWNSIIKSKQKISFGYCANGKKKINEPLELLKNAQKAVDNTGHTTSYSFTLDEENFTATVYSNTSPLSLNSASTTAIYGTIQSIKTKSHLKLNSSYSNDTKFQVKIFNRKEVLMNVSPILEKVGVSINFGTINFD